MVEPMFLSKTKDGHRLNIRQRMCPPILVYFSDSKGQERCDLQLRVPVTVNAKVFAPTQGQASESLINLTDNCSGNMDLSLSSLEKLLNPQVSLQSLEPWCRALDYCCAFAPQIIAVSASEWVHKVFRDKTTLLQRGRKEAVWLPLELTNLCYPTSQLLII